MRTPIHCVLAATALVCFLLLAPQSAHAQLIPPPVQSTQSQQDANLEEFLTKRLRAVNDDQRTYVRTVIALINDKKLDLKLVLSIERYAQRKSSLFPLPFFERALKVEAGKRGVSVPTIREMVATRSPLGPPPRSPYDTRITR
ncbi:hypothetical protein [Stieleria varia]|uniref:Uncharacterized protein n=1 Tax=Stieleria varia TaxID=2528005 RepID=A0A5C6ATG5_9BACT|nr:hypothetical protein [Stieleria varia]TWU02302.1 hypothetical protein Pla52n_33520 [Stieleria varia]